MERFTHIRWAFLSLFRSECLDLSVNACVVEVLRMSLVLFCLLSEAEQLRRELEDEREQQTLQEERHKQ